MSSVHRCLAVLLVAMLARWPAQAAELVVNGPPGSIAFGFQVETLPNVMAISPS